MANMTTAPAPRELAELIDRAAVSKERVILTRDGAELAAVVSIEDLRALEAMEAREDEIDASLFADAREALERGETISHAELKRRVLGSN
ncbi:MAG: type II toxin-antitoxin system prevent-host-death family antitoxin [Actinomycetota bacterium]